MNWTDLIDRVAERAGVSKADSRRVLTAFVDVTTEALSQGEKVVVRDLFTADSHWREGRILRSVSDLRKIRLDGRWTPRFRPSGAIRDALASRTPQLWRDPAHQQAWRVAEALVGDLVLYHAAKAPKVTGEAEPLAVDAACSESFGPLWGRARQSYEERVPQGIRSQIDHLALIARTRFATATP